MKYGMSRKLDEILSYKWHYLNFACASLLSLRKKEFEFVIRQVLFYFGKYSKII